MEQTDYVLYSLQSVAIIRLVVAASFTHCFQPCVFSYSPVMNLFSLALNETTSKVVTANEICTFVCEGRAPVYWCLFTTR